MNTLSTYFCADPRSAAIWLAEKLGLTSSQHQVVAEYEVRLRMGHYPAANNTIVLKRGDDRTNHFQVECETESDHKNLVEGLKLLSWILGGDLYEAPGGLQVRVFRAY